MSANVATVMSYVNRVLLDLKPKRQRSKDIFSSLLVLFFRCCCFARFTVFMKEEKKALVYYEIVHNNNAAQHSYSQAVNCDWPMVRLFSLFDCVYASMCIVHKHNTHLHQQTFTTHTINSPNPLYVLYCTHVEIENSRYTFSLSSRAQLEFKYLKQESVVCVKTFNCLNVCSHSE